MGNNFPTSPQLVHDGNRRRQTTVPIKNPKRREAHNERRKTKMSKSHTRARDYAEERVLLYYRNLSMERKVQFLSRIIMEEQAQKQDVSWPGR